MCSCCWRAAVAAGSSGVTGSGNSKEASEAAPGEEDEGGGEGAVTPSTPWRGGGASLKIVAVTASSSRTPS
eukprot:9625642-Prorocentrum_lima.AAC.1